MALRDKFQRLAGGFYGLVGALKLDGIPDGIPASDTLYKDNICAAWINFNGTGTIAIRDSFNVSSITDNGGLGDYTVTWDRDFADANYSAVPAAGPGVVGVLRTVNIESQLAGSMDLSTWNGGTGGSRFDVVNIAVHVFGNQ